MTTDPKLLSLIHSDSPPTKTEEQESQQSLDEYDEIDNKLEAEMERILEERIGVDTFQEMDQGSWAPIHKLPDEILGEILCCAAHLGAVTFKESDVYRIWPSHQMTFDTMPLSLFLVCKRWQHVTLQTPGIFHQLVITRESSLKLEKVLPMWLTHSGALPLDIHINEIPWMSETYDEIIFGALRGIGPHINRLTSLTLLLEHFSRVIPGSSLEAPCLRRFELLDAWPQDELEFGVLHAPALRDIYIRGILHYRHFLIHTPNQLQKFCPDRCKMRAPEFLSFLTEHSNLEDFNVELATPEQTIDGLPLSDSPLVKNSNLKSLSILYRCEAASDLEIIFSNLETPNLESLGIIPLDNDEEPHEYLAPILTWSLSVKPSLRALEIHLDSRYAEMDFHDLLFSLPSLKNW